MKLKLNRTLRAALIAAITAVGCTLSQAQAATGTEKLTLTKELQPVSGAVVSLSDLTYTWSIAGTPAQKDVSGSFAPDINVGANAGTWTLTFTMTNTCGNEITLDSLLLDVNMYTAGGGAQSSSTNRAIAFTLKEGDQTVGSIDTVMQGRGNTALPSFIYDPGTSSLTDQKPVLTFEGGKTLAANDSVTLSLTAARGSATTFQNGCFFGLLDIVASYTYQASECVWSGETSQIWGETAAWTGGVPSALTPAIFNENGKNTTVTINSEAAAASVTVSNAAYTFNMGETGSLSTRELVITGEGAKLTVNGEGRTMTVADITNDGELAIGTGATVDASAKAITLANGKSFKVSGEGTLKIDSATLNGGTLDVSSNLNITKSDKNTITTSQDGNASYILIKDGTTTMTGGIYMRGGNGSKIEIGTDTADATLITGRLEMGDYGSSSTSYLNIHKGSALVITSTNDVHGADGDYKNTGLLLSEWGQQTHASVAGKLYAQNVNLRQGNQALNITIADGGEIAVKGINKGSDGRNANSVITMNTGGKLILGADGMANDGGEWNITLNGGEVGMTADTTLARAMNLDGDVTFNTAKYVWENNQTLVTGSDGGTMTVSGNITGTGSLIKTGAGTLTLSGANTYTGDTVVNGGTLDIQGSINEQSTVKVAENATLAGHTENISMTIEAGKTATIAGDFTPKESGVTFYSDSTGVEVKNTGDAEITYGIDQEAAKVTADRLGVESGTAVTVKNEVVVWGIANFGEGDLTLTHVDVKPLESVNAHDGALTLQNITEVSLVEMVIASGSTVAVYKGDVANATQEGTVTITEKLQAGGGTLLANLEMANGSKLALSLEGGGMQALTLGSQFTIAEGALVRLDDATLEAIAGLANIGDTVILINEYAGSNLTTNLTDGDWARTHFDLSSITDAEFKMYVTDSAIGIVKSSMVPEPTTGTLSLLALAALAARRRRK